MPRYPRDPGPRTADVIADTVRSDILAGRLAPGEPIREEELAARHGISRHTARTALITLVGERLLTAEPYRGVRVSALGDDDLVALQHLRCALETEAVRTVRARGIRPPGIDQALDELEAAERRHDRAATADAHSRVHLALVAAADSPRITEVYRRLDSEMRLLLLHVRPAYPDGSLAPSHRAYVENALRDPEHAVRAHLDESTHAILQSRHG